MLKGKNIVVGITGGIAAYKIPLLVRELKKAHASVRVVMTEAAKEFVTPLTLSTLSQESVVVGTFPDSSSAVLKAGTWHIDLAQWAHVMVVAPATANVLAKLSQGYADDAVSTLALAVRCPIIISPAMDLDMWQHATTQENVGRLRQLGYIVLPPEEGELASGLVGPGRLPEIDVIVKAITDTLQRSHEDFKKKKILITAGPTYEAIDPVRFIANRSSGKMGFALATAAAQRGAEVTLITGPTHLPTPRQVRRINVETAGQMYTEVMQHRKGMSAVIMAAAVADFTPAHPARKKIKKDASSSAPMTLELEKTKDILHELSMQNSGVVIVGFALETHNDLSNAKKKLKDKKCDLLVLNNPMHPGAGFGVETNSVTIISKRGKIERLKNMSKYDVAHQLLDRVQRLM